MNGGELALDAMLEHLRTLERMPEDVCRQAAKDVEEAIRKTAGVSPDGKPWPAKKGGGRALAHVAEHIAAKAIGKLILVTLKGVDVFHNFGTSRVPRRQVLPDGGAGVPKLVGDAIRKTAGRVFSRAMGGG